MDAVPIANSTRNPSLGQISIWCCAIIFSMLALCSARFPLIDDAYITFRYAHNFAVHGELVFNRGEYLEAMTNLLWTLLLTPFVALGLSVEIAAIGLSLLLVLLACWRILLIAHRFDPSNVSGLVAVILLLGTGDFLSTAGNGLEAALYAALMAELVHAYAAGRVRYAFAMAGLLFMTRPEGLGFGVILVVLMRLRPEPWPLLLRGVAVFLGIVTAVTAFRLAYYGAVLPNSVLAKSVGLGGVSLRAGLTYAAEFLLGNGWVVLVLAGVLLVFRTARPAAGVDVAVAWLCAAGLALSLVVEVRNGGDWMPNFRLLSQYSVLYAILAALVLARLRAQPARFALTALLFATQPVTDTVVAALRVGADLDVLAHIQPVDMPFWEAAARRLAPVVQAEDVVSAEALGIVAYRLIGTRFHDPIGLADAHIARFGKPIPPFGKTDYAHTLGVVRPAVALWHDAGHLFSLYQAAGGAALLEAYEIRCQERCDTQLARLVMIRQDRVTDLVPAFSDWSRVAVAGRTLRPCRDDEDCRSR